MINAYDMLTGIQIALLVILFVYACFFQKERWCSVATFITPYVLVLVWSALVVGYFTEFVFLSVLWFLLGFFIGLGLVLYFRSSLPDMEYCPEHLRVKIPRIKEAPLCLSLFTLLATGLQQGVYVCPFIIHSWVFNELLGLIPGFLTGIVWGQMISMLFLAQLKRIKVYNTEISENHGR
ncbi:MAG: hypothetical protein LKF74_06680 [Megasphaera sp.]|jgi:hypothetical protein|nr:hypothetical protein [Megasphaera sp.]MCH4188387.1 hypothetical protein [Megasphaera sp.]MCH4218226.1 hypothetical protein [Megasphaera sp.]